jgi:hypothetical protein
MSEEFKFAKTSELFSEYNNKIIPSQDIDLITKYLDPEDDPDAISVFRTRLKCDKDRTKWDKCMEYWEKHRRITGEIGGCPKLGSEFVELIATKWKIKTYITGLLTRDGEIYDDMDFKVDLREERTRVGIAISDDAINDGVNVWGRKKHKEIKETIKKSIKYDGVSRDEIWEVVEDVFFASPKKGFIVAVIKKIIHSVKRKMHDLDVFDHLMFIITGLQGAGKGTFIDQFSKPIAEVTIASDFESFLDPRNMQMWRNFLCTFTECEKATKSDINSIKKRITDKGRAVKPLYSNGQSWVHNNLTCIGDANESVDMIFNDPTGSRRMSEGICKLQPNSTEAWEILNMIDWTGLWKSVDHTGPDPLIPFKADLIMQQKALTNEDVVEKWLLDDERDEHRLFPRLADKDEMLQNEIKTRWLPGENKQAETLWLENFYPWLKAMYPSYHYNFNTFTKQLNNLYRMKDDYLGITHSKPKNKSMWKFNVVNHSNEEELGVANTDDNENTANTNKTTKTANNTEYTSERVSILETLKKKQEEKVRAQKNGLGSTMNAIHKLACELNNM